MKHDRYLRKTDKLFKSFSWFLLPENDWVKVFVLAPLLFASISIINIVLSQKPRNNKKSIAHHFTKMQARRVVEDIRFNLFQRMERMEKVKDRCGG